MAAPKESIELQRCKNRLLFMNPIDKKYYQADEQSQIFNKVIGLQGYKYNAIVSEFVKSYLNIMS